MPGTKLYKVTVRRRVVETAVCVVNCEGGLMDAAGHVMTGSMEGVHGRHNLSATHSDIHTDVLEIREIDEAEYSTLKNGIGL